MHLVHVTPPKPKYTPRCTLLVQQQFANYPPWLKSPCMLSTSRTLKSGVLCFPAVSASSTFRSGLQESDRAGSRASMGLWQLLERSIMYVRTSIYLLHNVRIYSRLYSWWVADGGVGLRQGFVEHSYLYSKWRLLANHIWNETIIGTELAGAGSGIVLHCTVLHCILFYFIACSVV